ncbi:hypothetical protein B0H14DRAFT_2596602 [Mycena olivaceomarginata]|nr:hypothetical protein B0H14DRAFT_2596602 [Mycena olivaceomarginata]
MWYDCCDEEVKGWKMGMWARNPKEGMKVCLGQPWMMCLGQATTGRVQGSEAEKEGMQTEGKEDEVEVERGHQGRNMHICITAGDTSGADKNAPAVAKAVGVGEYVASTGIQQLNSTEYVSYSQSPGHTQSQFVECIARMIAGFWSYAKSMRVKAIGREEGRAGDGVGDENQCGHQEHML